MIDQGCVFSYVFDIMDRAECSQKKNLDLSQLLFNVMPPASRYCNTLDCATSCDDVMIIFCPLDGRSLCFPVTAVKHEKEKAKMPKIKTQTP